MYDRNLWIKTNIKIINFKKIYLKCEFLINFNFDVTWINQVKIHHLMKKQKSI